MFPFLLAAVLAAASPAPCPSDLLVANPRLRVVRAKDKAHDNYVVTVDVKNRGVAAQPMGTEQHLDLIRDGKTIGMQTLPAIGADETYAAAFRVQLPHARKRGPFSVEFRYILDSKNAAVANCTRVNDRLTATL